MGAQGFDDASAALARPHPWVPASAASLDDVERPAGYDDAMVTVWEDGRLLRDWTFAEIRARADAARL